MATRTNFYKNPSYTYNKDFSLNSALQNLRAYNSATGIASPAEAPIPDEEKVSHRKRHRERRLLRVLNNELKEKDGPMSHEDYIEKRRKEVNSSQAYQELTADVLEASSSGVHLVNYDSDQDSSSEFEEKEDLSNSSFVLGNGADPCISGDNKEDGQVKKRSEQRFPVPGEPVCVICGKYGEYICNETDDDICSIDCKIELLENLKLQKGTSSNQSVVVSSLGTQSALPLPELEGDTWDYNRHRWSEKISSLCTYKCWKCKRPGHLAEDCLVMTSNSESVCSVEASNEVALGKKITNSISRDLRELYRRCHQIGKNLSAVDCNICRRTSSLATCIDCSTTFCDSAGHLSEHIRAYPSHRQYYSNKLKRLVKCCKSTCKVTDIKDLLACHYCFNKAFDKFYDMYTATWKEAGLSIIWNSICCEDHFDWHRMNCMSADVEDSAYIVKKHSQNDKHIQLSDFIF